MQRYLVESLSPANSLIPSPSEAGPPVIPQCSFLIAAMKICKAQTQEETVTCASCVLAPDVPEVCPSMRRKEAADPWKLIASDCPERHPDSNFLLSIYAGYLPSSVFPKSWIRCWHERLPLPLSICLWQLLSLGPIQDLSWTKTIWASKHTIVFIFGDCRSGSLVEMAPKASCFRFI